MYVLFLSSSPFQDLKHLCAAFLCSLEFSVDVSLDFSLKLLVLQLSQVGHHVVVGAVYASLQTLGSNLGEHMRCILVKSFTLFIVCL